MLSYRLARCLAGNYHKIVVCFFSCPIFITTCVKLAESDFGSVTLDFIRGSKAAPRPSGCASSLVTAGRVARDARIDRTDSYADDHTP